MWSVVIVYQVESIKSKVRAGGDVFFGVSAGWRQLTELEPAHELPSKYRLLPNFTWDKAAFRETFAGA